MVVGEEEADTFILASITQADVLGHYQRLAAVTSFMMEEIP